MPFAAYNLSFTKRLRQCRKNIKDNQHSIDKTKHAKHSIYKEKNELYFVILELDFLRQRSAINGAINAVSKQGFMKRGFDKKHYTTSAAKEEKPQIVKASILPPKRADKKIEANVTW